MSSILKVDQIQLSNGNTPTAGDLGLNTTGTIIQTVTNSSTTTVTATSTTPVNLIAVSITPKFANSVIHIEAYIGTLEIGIGSSNAYCSCYLNDPSGNLIGRTVSGQMAFGTDTHTLFGTHSPNSTSSQTYQVTMGTASGGTGQVHTNSQRYSIRAMEIAG